jgi:transposase, IS30 family
MKQRGQLTEGERYAIALGISKQWSKRQIARTIGRPPSTVTREIERNSCSYDGRYRAEKAQARAISRRSRSRRNSQYSQQEWGQVQALIKRKWSPEQIAGRRQRKGRRRMSHETIYRRVRQDRLDGGELWRHMRHMGKPWRKRKGSPATRGRVLGKRHISERPAEAQGRHRPGHYEADTVMGADQRHCILTLVERVTGWTVIRKLKARNKREATRALLRALSKLPIKARTLTLDNGTEFHDYAELERRLGVKVYFATPYHSWERGTNENTNGLIRQYLPKGQCMKNLTQRECNWIANELNTRPRKRLGFTTPAEVVRRSRRCCV